MARRKWYDDPAIGRGIADAGSSIAGIWEGRNADERLRQRILQEEASQGRSMRSRLAEGERYKIAGEERASAADQAAVAAEQEKRNKLLLELANLLQGRTRTEAAPIPYAPGMEMEVPDPYRDPNVAAQSFKGEDLGDLILGLAAQGYKTEGLQGVLTSRQGRPARAREGESAANIFAETGVDPTHMGALGSMEKTRLGSRGTGGAVDPMQRKLILDTLSAHQEGNTKQVRKNLKTIEDAYGVELRKDPRFHTFFTGKAGDPSPEALQALAAMAQGGGGGGTPTSDIYARLKSRLGVPPVAGGGPAVPQAAPPQAAGDRQSGIAAAIAAANQAGGGRPSWPPPSEGMPPPVAPGFAEILGGGIPEAGADRVGAARTRAMEQAGPQMGELFASPARLPGALGPGGFPNLAGLRQGPQVDRPNIPRYADAPSGPGFLESLRSGAGMAAGAMGAPPTLGPSQMTPAGLPAMGAGGGGGGPALGPIGGALKTQTRAARPKAFNDSVAKILEREGGYSNDPQDRGGETKFGISTVANPDVNIDTLTEDQAKDLYYERYYQPIHGDALATISTRVMDNVFDFAVNSGPKQAISKLQDIIGTQPDGVMGPKTKTAIRDFIAQWGEDDLIESYKQERLLFLQKLSSWDRFGTGWQKRVESV